MGRAQEKGDDEVFYILAHTFRHRPTLLHFTLSRAKGIQQNSRIHRRSVPGGYLDPRRSGPWCRNSEKNSWSAPRSTIVAHAQHKIYQLMSSCRSDRSLLRFSVVVSSNEAWHGANHKGSVAQTSLAVFRRHLCTFPPQTIPPRPRLPHSPESTTLSLFQPAHSSFGQRGNPVDQSGTLLNDIAPPRYSFVVVKPIGSSSGLAPGPIRHPQA